MNAGVRYALKFAALALPLFVVYSFPYPAESAPAHWFERYLSTYAEMAGCVLGWFDPTLQVHGSVIEGRFAVQIAKSCDAMDVSILFSAAVLAFPAPWRQRLAALGAGVLVLTLANVLRICALYFIGWRAPGVFESAHLEWFPLLMLLVGVGQFLLWTRWQNGREFGVSSRS